MLLATLGQYFQICGVLFQHSVVFFFRKVFLNYIIVLNIWFVALFWFSFLGAPVCCISLPIFCISTYSQIIFISFVLSIFLPFVFLVVWGIICCVCSLFCLLFYLHFLNDIFSLAIFTEFCDLNSESLKWWSVLEHFLYLF